MRRQQGFGHIGVVLAIVVVAVIAFGGWYVWHKNQTKDVAGSLTDKTIQEAIKNAKCDYNDKDLCKFFTGWKAQKYYTISSTNESDGKTSKSLVKVEGTDKYHLKIEGDTPYEIIGIGDVLYTKASNGTWWKQTIPKDKTDQYKPQNGIPEPDTTTSDAPDAPKITYKKIGKEKCGNLTCFKYQEIDPSNTKTKNYLWFDDKDYQLRRNHTDAEDYTYDAILSYDKISVTEPSPVKELQPGQYIVPGQSEPVTTPSDEDLQQMIQQYQGAQ